MHEALEGVEAHDGAPRASALDAHHAAPEIEDDEHGQNAQDGDAADPTKSHLVEMAPIAAGGLLDRAGLLIGQGTAAGDCG